MSKVLLGNLNRIKKGDIIIIGIVVTAIIFLLFFFGSNKQAKSEAKKLNAVIIRDGNIIEEIDLNELHNTHIVEIDEDYKITIVAKQGQAKFIESTCPDKICIKTGWVRYPGDVAVCMPGRTILKIEEEN